MKSEKQTVGDREIANAMRKAQGMRTIAAEELGMSYAILSWRISKSLPLKELEDEISAKRLDLAEMVLLKLIEGGNLQAVMFYLRFKGQSRGYAEKTVEDSGPITIEARNPRVTSQTHNPVPVEKYLPDIEPPEVAIPLMKAWKRDKKVAAAEKDKPKVRRMLSYDPISKGRGRKVEIEVQDE